MNQAVSQKKGKIKICWFEHNILGVPKWIPASINHFIQIGTSIYGLKVVRKKENYVNVMLLKFMVVKIQYREKKSFLGHPAYCSQITRSWFFPFSIWLPDWFLKSFKCISDLKVICAQSWGDIEAFLALRSAKVSSQQPPPSVHFAGNTLYFGTSRVKSHQTSYFCSTYFMKWWIFLSILTKSGGKIKKFQHVLKNWFSVH